MFKFLKNLKTRYLWIMFGVMVVVSGLMTFVCTTINNQTLSLIILIILYLITGAFFEMAIARLFERKHQIKYNEVIYEYVKEEDIVESLRKNAFNSHKLSYGKAFIKIVDKTVYKVIFIKDMNNYKNPSEEDSKGTKTKGIDDCTKFIGVELFYDYDDEMKEKIRDFSFCGEKVYYTGLYVKEDSLVKPNHIPPTEDFKDDYDNFMKILGINSEKEN